MTRMKSINRPGSGAFTLVELLVVIAIIAILIGILVPAVSIIRIQARKASTNATLTSLDTAIQSYRADGKLGGGLPPSASDWIVGNISRVANPYTPGIAGPGFHITGAGLLYWALAGADSLGTPGFRVFRTTAAQFWGQDTGNTPTGTNPSAVPAYALEPSTLRAMHPRTGPYVDLDKIGRSALNRAGTSFEIPAELDANPTAPNRQYPMFLDAFGFPILYFKADPAGVVVADQTYTYGNPNERGIYHWRDNAALVDPNFGDEGNPDQVLTLKRAGRPHTLSMNAQYPGSTNGQFLDYIVDPSIRARPTPYRRDTYLLISPGPDGLYGTGDDIANFEHNGR